MTHVAPAARDFSALFGNGSIQAVLHVTKTDENAVDILTRPTFVTDASTATYSTPRTESCYPPTLAESVGTWMLFIHSHPCLRLSRQKHVHGL